VGKPGAAQSTVAIGRPGPPWNTPDYCALQVMNTMLGGMYVTVDKLDIVIVGDRKSNRGPAEGGQHRAHCLLRHRGESGTSNQIDIQTKPISDGSQRSAHDERRSQPVFLRRAVTRTVSVTPTSASWGSTRRSR
jgi:hypothetical protein